MKIIKKIFKIAFLFIILGTIGLYFYFYQNNLSTSLKTGFFLAFREKIYISEIQKEPLTPFIVELKGIYSDNLFINKIKFNYLTKELYINRIIINKAFYNKLKAFLKDINYLPLSLKKVTLINLELLKLKKVSLNINFQKNDILFNGVGFYNNIPLALEGSYDYKTLLSNIDFPDTIKLTFLCKLFDIELPKEIKNFPVKAKLILSGNLNSFDSKKVLFQYKNYKLEFLENNKIDLYKISNGKIFINDNNIINFYGEIFNDKNYTLHFNTDNYINATLENNLYFENLKLNCILHRDFSNKNLNINLTADKLNALTINIFKSFFQNWHLTTNINISNLSINNTAITNFSSIITFKDNIVNINKFNFKLDDGEFKLSLIHNHNNYFQSAVEIKHLNIKKFLSLSGKDSLLDGLLNVTFIGEGNNKNFSDAKGYFFIEDFSLQGINSDNLTFNFKENNLINLKIFGSDNSSITKIKFDMVKGFVKGDGHFLKFPKIMANSKHYYFNIFGKLDIENFNNFRLNGLYSTDNFSKNIILNIDLKNNLIQLVPRND